MSEDEVEENENREEQECETEEEKTAGVSFQERLLAERVVSQFAEGIDVDEFCSLLNDGSKVIIAPQKPSTALLIYFLMRDDYDAELYALGRLFLVVVDKDKFNEFLDNDALFTIYDGKELRFVNRLEEDDPSTIYLLQDKKISLLYRLYRVNEENLWALCQFIRNPVWPLIPRLEDLQPEEEEEEE
jgi:hypothetical protein